MYRRIYIVLCIIVFSKCDECKPSPTTASGSSAPKKICSGQLIFHEPFDELDKRKWIPLNTFWNGGNNEFQWYSDDNENSYTNNSKLYITPTLTVDIIGKPTLETGYVHLLGCNDENNNKSNCERKGDKNQIINPVRSARLDTKKSFSFKYGMVQVIAQIPEGDWLWPAIWFTPTASKYGRWPRSGEIDLLEARGNIKYGNHIQIGVEQVQSAVHFGLPDKYSSIIFKKNNASGYHTGFHKYRMNWNQTDIRFSIDGYPTGHVKVENGLWQRAGFTRDNIWTSGTKMAPFDQEFNIVINLAIGGKFFTREKNHYGPRPWTKTNNYQKAMKEFWNAREQWKRTWRTRESSSFKIDDIKVWAI